jgi:hypothetical protein
LYHTIALFDTLSLEATMRAMGHPQSALRQLLFEDFQADRIASRQRQILNRGEPRLTLLPHGQVTIRQNTPHCLANCLPQPFLKLRASAL